MSQDHPSNSAQSVSQETGTNDASSSPAPAMVPQLRSGDRTSVVREFHTGNFEEWPSWDRLLRLLTVEPSDESEEDRSDDGAPDPRGGGSYGLAGPRGAGKSWLMKRAVAHAREKGGLGLWYPSPSEYNSMAFLASLSETLSNEIEENRRRKKSRRYSTLGLWGSPYWGVFSGLLLGVYIAVVIPLVFGISAAVAIPLGLTAGAVLAALSVLLRRVRLSSTDEGRLRLYAAQLKQQVRFTLTRREAMEFGAEAGKGLLGKVGLSREQELVERPLTLSTLIQDFRELARLAGEYAAGHGGPVVIAIDELDKMSEHERVRQLLRDIKGIFGVSNVYFLVSVSDEAARALNLNGLAERNEFNSSFDAVIELPPLSIAACEKLLRNRGFLSDVSRLLAILSGGIPRELVRLAELVDSSSTSRASADQGTGQPADSVRAQEVKNSRVAFAVCEAMKVEALEFRHDVVTATAASAPVPTDEAKRGVFQLLSERNFRSDQFASFATGAMPHHWIANWHDSAWDARFAEAWRRLLVRLHVAGRIVSDPEQLSKDESAYELQRVVAMSSHSATVARSMVDSSFADAPGPRLATLLGFLARLRNGNGTLLGARDAPRVN